MYVRVHNVTKPEPAVDSYSLQKQAYLSSEQGEEDIRFYGEAATQMVEQHIDQSLITRQLKMSVARDLQPSRTNPPFGPAPGRSLAGWNRLGIRADDFILLRGPVQSVEKVELVGWDGNASTLVQGTDYYLSLATSAARVRLTRLINWLTCSHLEVTYTAGYGPEPSDVPADIRQAIRLMATHFNEHRGDTADEFPPAYGRLLSQYRSF